MATHGKDAEKLDIEPIFPSWSRSVGECKRHFKVKVCDGLSISEAEERCKLCGYNELEKHPSHPLWKLVLEQFDHMLVKKLLVAAIISFALAYFDGHGNGGVDVMAYVEPLVILAILILNAVVGVWQESNSERALEALKEMQSEHAKIMRNGIFMSDLPARELVPGDIVKLRVRDKVPVDMRVAHLKTSTFRVEQSSLTGKSMAVIKTHH
ncbi:hypothetical protein L7F22_000114 [Adiantum nelumboides]|nr:hypothetical protein [Adiantum nelumboides]